MVVGFKNRRFKFQKWANKVGEILERNDLKGFLSNQGRLYKKSDPISDLLDDLISEGTLDLDISYSAKELAPYLEEAFSSFANLRQNTQALASWLRRNEGKTVNEFLKVRVYAQKIGNKNQYTFRKDRESRRQSNLFQSNDSNSLDTKTDSLEHPRHPRLNSQPEEL